MKLLIVVVSFCITTARSQGGNNVGMYSVSFDNQYRAVDPFVNRAAERAGSTGGFDGGFAASANGMAADGPAPNTVIVSDQMFGDQAYTPRANSPDPMAPVDPDQPVEDYIKAEERGNPMNNMARGAAGMVGPGASRSVGNMGNMAGGGGGVGLSGNMAGGRGGVGLSGNMAGGQGGVGLSGSANRVAPNTSQVGRMGNMGNRGTNGRVAPQRRSNNRRQGRNNRSRNVIYDRYNGGSRREKNRKPYSKRTKYEKKQPKGGY
ncbi:PE-PGRS family protein PE_PGRS5-like [Mytilus trossulus]|uniref:PE-PGRS family protein PE_PGRS5-like n=1 Tax=Mytilus trossulus TaxID=6551 RepID=UPI003006706F